jgi:hypothetical protein
MHTRRTLANTSLAFGIAVLLSACPAINKRERDIDRTPVVDTGAGATILMPGQTAPVYQGPIHPRENNGGGAYGAPAPGNTQGSAHGAPASAPGSSVTMIGGNTTEEERHQKVNEEPIWFKYAALPFAVAAAPFVALAEAVRPEPTPGPEVPRLENAPPPPPEAPAPSDYETATLQAMERELEQRNAASAPPPPGTTPQSASAGSLSLASELAALRQPRNEPAPGVEPLQTASLERPATPAPTANPKPVSTPLPQDASLVTASGQVDRNGDGRTDHWIFRKQGEIEREQLDEDFDGRPDKTLHYDLATHQVNRVEEDGNRDGRLDTWISLREGAVVGRRTDEDGDGHVDSWGFYREGTLTRLDRDSSGDGFRDHVSHYRNGRLEREERDTDADGRAETILHYDGEQIARREEDTDRDGDIDVISHYEGGKLKRRELLDASATLPAPRMTEHN